MLEIGVQVDEDAEEVIVKQYNQNVLSLTYDTYTDIWYQKKSEWVEEGFNRYTDGIFGLNVGGNFVVVALDEAGNTIDSVEVNITPGTMSIEEYQLMQQEVRRLFEIFSYGLADDQLDENNVLRRIQLRMYPLQSFTTIVQEIAMLINELIERPEVELKTVVSKINVKDVRKWTPSIIIEDALKQKGKVTAFVNEQVTDIKENRMLKYIVEQFLERSKSELAVEQRQLKLFEEEIVQLETMISQSSYTLAEKPKQLLNVLQNDCSKLQQRIEQWLTLIVALNDLLELPILQVESIQLEETHLFRMHPHYSEIYDLFIQYEKLTPEFTDTFRLFIQALLKSPTLYEVWVLLKIIEQFSQWGLDPKEFVQDIEEKYVKPNTHSISGYRKRFRLRGKPFDIGIYYDFTFEESGYRPDFVIGFYNKNIKKWVFHSLDAKYKNYGAMKNGQKKFYEDLKDSAAKYLKELIPNSGLLQSASLVHLDSKAGHWNAKPGDLVEKFQYHKLAHFMLSPNKSKNLQIYLKRLLHEGSHFENCCPSCGCEKKGEIQNYRVIRINKRRWKTLYKCEDCKELWVANFCSDCFFNEREQLNGYDEERRHAYIYPRPLYKYPTYNYNLQVGDEWEVHCPSCNRLSYPERQYTFVDDDYKGPKVQYHTRSGYLH